MEMHEITGIDSKLSGIILSSAGRDLFDYDDTLTPVTVEKYNISPWGTNNNLPQEIRANIEKSDIMSTNLRFNRDVCYGLGPKLVDLIRNEKGKVVDFAEADDGEEYEFFTRNDISMFLLEQFTDMMYFHNAFSELIPDKSSGKIYSIRHKEAMFSRWSVMNNKGVIDTHFYASNWKDTPSLSNITPSQVIDEFNALGDAQARITLGKKRMIYPVYMPSPGRPYYSRPDWYSLFESGWYDHSIAIPALKKAIMKNNLGVKFIIYISPRYWEEVLQNAKVDKSDPIKVKAVKDQEVKAMTEFLSGAESAAKAIITMQEYSPAGNTAILHKWIEIVPVKNDITGGEFISDIETVANIMSYAMGVHPSLIGAVPGKNGGSMGGTDKRELFLMKQALMKPVVDRCLRPLQLIRQVNGWKKDRTIVVPEYIFTTLDQNKSGKQESTNNNM